MSDKRLVEFDNKGVARVMSTAVVRSRRYLEALTVAHHRGPHDTWTAARDRAAKTAGIERSYAARIWNRWQDMKDVSGEAFMRLSEAYESLCEQAQEHERRLDAEGVRLAREITRNVVAHRLEEGAKRMAIAKTETASSATTEIR